MGFKDFIKQLIAKTIASGIVLTVTVGIYSFTIYIGQYGIKIPDATVDAIIKAVISLIASYSIWQGSISNSEGTASSGKSIWKF